MTKVLDGFLLAGLVSAAAAAAPASAYEAGGWVVRADVDIDPLVYTLSVGYKF